MSDRELILDRIRAATGDVPPDEPDAWSPEARSPGSDPDPEAAYIRERVLEPERLAALFAERCADYRASVTRCADQPEAIAAAVANACRRHAVATLAVPAQGVASWVPGEVEVRTDDPSLSLERLDGCDGVLTGCAVAIALTGTIVLDTGLRQGRRMLTLIPDLHICVVRCDQIVSGVPDAFAVLDESLRMRRPLTFISGPSATSDIELRRVEGVHGPRRLEVVVADG